MKLIIVESPTKARTISRFVGKEFVVESSFGHVRDLASSSLSVDVEHNFEPKYVIPKKALPTIKHLKEILKKADALILATDEDREGEAIAWHLTEALDPSKTSNGRKKKTNNTETLPPTERIVFHEITKHAIEEALAHPRTINMQLVDAQQARRVLDRLVGYKLSPFLWKKVMRGLSAGRVQSVALRLIVKREKEIEAFVAQTYWSIAATLVKAKESFRAELVRIGKDTIPKPGLTDKSQVLAITEALKNAAWQVAALEQKAAERSPLPPFTTSTVQQAAWQRLGFSAKKTMMLAQQLYEGIEISGEGSTGLITYMRTDSLNVAEGALADAHTYIANAIGERYALPRPRRFKTSTKGAQEAHEAIRPANAARAPDTIKTNLSRDQFRLYDLIWRRFIASQMQPALFETSTATILAQTAAEQYTFRAKGIHERFDGFTRIWQIKTEEVVLPKLQEGDALLPKNIAAEEHETQPPARYTDASLVKTLEQYGIGRPSTYASIISVIQERNYVEKNKDKRFVPTEIGRTVDEILSQNFPSIVDVEFTAHIEEELDKIAEGKKKWQPIIKTFYEPFAELLAKKYETVTKKDLTEPAGENCEQCGKPMVIKYGRFGKFIACSGFPDCKNTRPLPPRELGIACPACGETDGGKVVERRGKKGRTFFGCSRYPSCNFATWKKPTGTLCPECKAPLVEERAGEACSSKTCGWRKTKTQNTKEKKATETKDKEEKI